MGRQLHTGAHGIIRRHDEILVVRQHPDWAPHAYWSLPGGTSEPGELLHETLVREVHEEVGLIVHDATLAWVMHEDRPYRDDQLLVFHFEVTSWSGEPTCEDPVGLVDEARFVPVPQALELLRGTASHQSPHTLEPLLAWFGSEPDTRPHQLWNMRRVASDAPAERVSIAPIG